MVQLCDRERSLSTRLLVSTQYANVLSPVDTCDKVEFNTVDFVKSRQSRPCGFGPVHTATVDFVADLLTVSATVDFQQSRPC